MKGPTYHITKVTVRLWQSGRGWRQSKTPKHQLAKLYRDYNPNSITVVAHCWAIRKWYTLDPVGVDEKNQCCLDYARQASIFETCDIPPKEYGKPETSWNHGSKSSKSSISSIQTWVQRVFFRSLPWVPLGIDRVEVPDSLVPGVWCGPMRLALTAWVTPRPSSSRIICFLSTVEVCFCTLPTWNSL